MANTKIPYVDTSWNPVTGCTKTAVGCKHCWAEGMAKRQRGRNGYDADEPFRVTLRPERLGQPLSWRKPRRVAVCFMGDLFHKDVPFEFILKAFAVMLATPWHTYLLFTKRPQRMAEFYEWWIDQATCRRYATLQDGMAQDALEIDESHWARADQWYLENCDQSRRGRLDNPVPWPWPHAHLYASVSTDDDAQQNAPWLLECQAAVRGLSIEPLLGPIDVRPWSRFGSVIVGCESLHSRLGRLSVDGTATEADWLGWCESIVRQCAQAGVPVWVKQIPAGGKLCRDVDQFPKPLRRRELPT